MCYASKYLKSIEGTVKEIELTKKKLIKSLSGIDKQISDKYHQIETKRFNAAEGYYLSKDLQLLLQQRRVIKHEHQKLHSLSNRLKDTLDIGKMKKSLDKISKNNQVYQESFHQEAYEILQ